MAGKSTCTQEHIDKGMEYIAGGYVEQGETIPTADGLAIYMNVTRATPYNWAKQESCQFRDEMAYIIDRVQAIQGMKVVSGGLTGEFNPAFAGKVAANHGYGEKHTFEHSGPGGSAIKTESKIEWTIQPVKPVNEADSDG